MEALLKITTIPMEYELKVEHARLERGRSSPPLIETHRQKGGLHMHSRPASLKLDTYEARNSVVPTTKNAIYQAAQRGLQAAGDAAQTYAREMAQMQWSKPGEGGKMLQQIFTQRMEMPDGQFEMKFIPTTGAHVSYQKGELSTEYQMDRLTFNLKLNNGTVEFIPGSIDMIITQYPDVQIEYMGKHLYVPPSAAEHFTGGEMDKTA